MTELQNCELNILKEFIRVCDELKLTYYMVCGSALGAVKYGGFIPWDDDVDVALPRRDYDLFISKAQPMLPENLFVQTYLTDPAYPNIYGKIRNSQTTFIERSYKNLDMNHGVYIDIFPLDGYPQDSTEAQNFEKEKERLYRQRYAGISPWYHRDAVLTANCLLNRFGVSFDTAEACRLNEELIKKYPLSESELWCNYGNSMLPVEYAPHGQYGGGAWASFEGLEVRVPENFDDYLTQKYGDWRADIPAEQKLGHHRYTVCDLSKSYRNYIGGRR